MISICILKMCGESISKSCIEKGQFPVESKKANVVPVHKRVIHLCQKTTDLFHNFQYVEKHLNV